MTESFGGKPSIFARFFGDIFSMPAWQKGFLSLAALLGGAGVVGQTYSKLAPSQPPHQPPPAQVQQDSTAATPPPAGSSNFVDQHPPMTNSTPAIGLPPPADSTTIAPQSTLIDTHSPWMTRIGLSFVGGFIIGWAFRVFIKTMAIVTVLGVALLTGLSYFHVVNVDFSKAKVEYADSISWITDQAGKVKDVALTYFPSTGTSMAGVLMGFRKK